MSRRTLAWELGGRDDGTAKKLLHRVGIEGNSFVTDDWEGTNWDFGKAVPAKAGINILMLSVEWRGIGVPLLGVLLPSAGNSNTRTRICLLDRLRLVFPEMKIAALTGEREFIGDAWMALARRKLVPDLIRDPVRSEASREPICGPRGLCDVDRRRDRARPQAGQKDDPQGPLPARPRPWTPRAAGAPRHPQAGKRRTAGSGHLVKPAARALARYRARWKIESLFGNLKTRGFNLEAEPLRRHLADPAKLSTLLALLAIAVALSLKTGLAAQRLRPIPIKTHGRKATSLFANGLHALRKILATQDRSQAFAFLEKLLSPKSPLKPLKSMAI